MTLEEDKDEGGGWRQVTILDSGLILEYCKAKVLKSPYESTRYRLGLPTLKTGFCQQRAVFMCIEHGDIVYLYIVLA